MTGETQMIILRHGLRALLAMSSDALRDIEPWLTRDMVRLLLEDRMMTTVTRPEDRELMTRLDATVTRLEQARLTPRKP
jgi:hypothetical protein